MQQFTQLWRWWKQILKHYFIESPNTFLYSQSEMNESVTEIVNDDVMIVIWTHIRYIFNQFDNIMLRFEVFYDIFFNDAQKMHGKYRIFGKYYDNLNEFSFKWCNNKHISSTYSTMLHIYYDLNHLTAHILRFKNLTILKGNFSVQRKRKKFERKEQIKIWKVMNILQIIYIRRFC